MRVQATKNSIARQVCASWVGGDTAESDRFHGDSFQVALFSNPRIAIILKLIFGKKMTLGAIIMT
jgi:hypothetical protein